jgi:SAM-dependent methyltransferase
MPRRTMLTTTVLALTLALFGVGLAPLVLDLPRQGVQAQALRRDVPYVPTPQRVVDEMLTLAAVTRDDVVYDLGSGDGRIVITAAKKYGARGVGVDIDPERIRESNENARKAGVTDRVKFLQQDLFTIDLKDATVVTLYLLPEVNLRLRPKLLRELRPGTRVVSHSFDMGDWKPQKTVEVNQGRSHTIYFWVIPAREEAK